MFYSLKKVAMQFPSFFSLICTTDSCILFELLYIVDDTINHWSGILDVTHVTF